MPNWDEIKKEWEETKVTLAALAEKHGVKLGTLKSRKSREKWSRDATKKVATKKKKDATGKRGAPIGNSNAKGNRGNKNASAPEQNSNALKHGLFSRYIPRETLAIMGMMGKDNPADLIWDQIMIQYAAIIRAQEIMHVESKHEIIKELKKVKVETSTDKDGNIIQTPTEQEYEFQFAWDRQATFLKAQSRAMSELRSLIKQFNEMAHDEDERRLKLELMQANIDKSKAEVERISQESGDDIEEIIIVDKWGGNDD